MSDAASLKLKDIKVDSTKFSIITVVLNNAETIEQTIGSVVNQAYNNYEYIIIDGASTDSTVEIINKYKDKITYFISEPDDGIYYAMNKGIEVSTGEYLIFLNGDDYFDSNHVLERIACYCNGKNIVIGKEYCGNRLSDVVDLSDVQSKFFGIFYPHQATFIPRKLFDIIGKYAVDYSISADFEWICRAIYNKTEISWVDVVVSHYTIGGISSKINCDIDEFNISFKYMMLSNEQSLIPDMKKYTCEKAKNTIFREILQDELLSESIKSKLSELIDINNGISLWGAGFLSGLYIQMFNRIEVPINYIIDRRGVDAGSLGIAIVKYKKELIHQLFVTSEVYDDEITTFLEKEGFRNERDFFSQKKFRDRMIQVAKSDYESIKKFENLTGIKLF